MLQGKIALIQGDIKDFESYYQLALDLANKFELKFLKDKINNSLEELRKEISRYRSIINDETSLIERMNEVDVLEYIQWAKSEMGEI